jgi:hypothetical protein
MAKGDPLRAKEIFETLDQVWFERWAIWRRETHNAKVPDAIVGFYGKK